jgi:signal transduction histidine kinase
MRELAAHLARFAASWRSDLLVAGVVVASMAGYELVAAMPANQRWLSMALVLPWCAALAVRRRQPLVAVAVCCLVLLAFRPLGLDRELNGPLDIFAWTLFLLTYSLGTMVGWLAGLAAVVAFTVALQVESVAFNPFFEIITAGPWLTGRIVASRRRLTDQLQVRNAELDAEREAFARESVRYERARIARDLHDIIAHNISMIVVQAGAGRRLVETGTGQADESLAFIAGAARDALDEVGQLVELLANQPRADDPPGLAMLGELVRRASSAGLSVTCQLVGDWEQVSPGVSDSAYRIVQESLTNALKHAPGAPVRIVINAAGDRLEVQVSNAAPARVPDNVARYGGGHGLAGMQQRVASANGRFEAGPAPGGGWRVAATLPQSADPSAKSP